MSTGILITIIVLALAAAAFGLLIARLDRRRVRDIEENRTDVAGPKEKADAARGRYIWRRNH